ncbi:Rpn family recombination-promoting nuclease/putative transposase [Candidatus Bandiella euplotis]|uniref:PD-(D/E)XK nuclease family transposase n=1 Tax=Candidatus Bandiella euplotis TaxID=1664265 RepID=A0ABZ0UMI8_9RICK|nr:Rpn family recombination-promoting nuclease/putative transposase [Candidatus Bandiella woodruffii]WPX96584.1 PD-(D/E)XK nuclease family transposase [Candidatus Bandiella woodruffii]WPX97388.1 PD-(D/E)XK nuclease family transposase [Candidatus Bandiella woodruffii]
MTIVKYLNPRNDIAFKKIFGTEKNKDILMHFLNDVIEREGKKEITKVRLLNPMQHPELIGKKQSVVDVLCEEEDGTQYIVEMQVAKVGGFEKRAQYYAAKAYSSQAEEGYNYDHLKEVIFLAITEYEMFPKKKGYKSVHYTLDKKTYERDLKDFSFTFIELKKFNKRIEELKSFEDKWCYFFKYANDPDDMGELIKNSDEVITKAYHELEAHHWTKDELRAYEASEKIARDNKAREAYLEGLAEQAELRGIEKGIEKGREEGREEGIKKGKIERNYEIAKNMLSHNISAEIISQSTGLSIDEINNLKN